MRITTIINGKGGVGKTTTAHALATGLNPRRYKSLAVDYDPQGNLSLAYGADVMGSPTMYHVLNGEVTLAEAVQHTEQGDILVGNASLTKIEKMYAGEDYLEGIGKLRSSLQPLEGYTHVFIDNQPLIGGLLTMQALAAATDLVVPMSAETFAVQGFSRLQKAIESIRMHFNPGLRIDGILLTKYATRTIISSHIRETIVKWAEEFGTRVYDAAIREGVSVREAQAKHQSLFAYAPYANPTLDYKAFIKEYLQTEEA